MDSLLELALASEDDTICGAQEHHQAAYNADVLRDDSTGEGGRRLASMVVDLAA